MKNLLNIKSLFKKVLKLSKICLVFAVIFTLVYIVANSKPVVPDSTDFDIFGSSFGANPVHLPFAASNEVSTILDKINNTPELRLESLMQVYSLICTRLALVDSYATRSVGTVNFKALSIEGLVTTTTCEVFNKVGTPTLNPNQQKMFSNKTIVRLDEVKGASSLKDTMENAINFGERKYSDGQNVFKNRGTIPYIDANGGEARWGRKVENSTFEQYDKDRRKYKDDELREVSEIMVSHDSVIANSIKFKKVQDKKDTKYEISFELDCSDTSEGSPLYYEAESIKRQVGSILLGLNYTQLKVKMTVYNNGYLASWASEQSYEAEFDLFITRLKGASSMTGLQSFSYGDADTKIVDFRTTAVV